MRDDAVRFHRYGGKVREEAVSTGWQNAYGGATLLRQDDLYMKVKGLTECRTFGGWFDAIHFDAGGGSRSGLLRRHAGWASPRRRPLRARSLAAALSPGH